MYQPYFHVGVLVKDIDIAVQTFGEKLGLQFEEIRTGAVATGETTRYCYSVQGAPHIELLEMTGNGIFGSDQEGLHHLGFATPDLPGSCAAIGGHIEPIVLGQGGESLVAYAEPESLHGVRVEFLTETLAGLTAARLAKLAADQGLSA